MPAATTTATTTSGKCSLTGTSHRLVQTQQPQTMLTPSGEDEEDVQMVDLADVTRAQSPRTLRSHCVRMFLLSHCSYRCHYLQ